MKFLIQLLRALLALLDPQPPTKGVKVTMSCSVKDDHAPVNFSLVLGDVTDAEGNPISISLKPIWQSNLNISSFSETFIGTAKD